MAWQLQPSYLKGQHVFNGKFLPTRSVNLVLDKKEIEKLQHQIYQTILNHGPIDDLAVFTNDQFPFAKVFVLNNLSEVKKEEMRFSGMSEDDIEALNYAKVMFDSEYPHDHFIS